jgi:hypothetical protein
LRLKLILAFCSSSAHLFIVTFKPAFESTALSTVHAFPFNVDVWNVIRDRNDQLRSHDQGSKMKSTSFFS